jgi:hypothetical protein
VWRSGKGGGIVFYRGDAPPPGGVKWTQCSLLSKVFFFLRTEEQTSVSDDETRERRRFHVVATGRSDLLLPAGLAVV